MRKDKNSEPHALFQSIDDNGRVWLFNIFADDEWAITHDDEQVAAGTSDRASIQSGVQKFLSLTRDNAGQAHAVCA